MRRYVYALAALVAVSAAVAIAPPQEPQIVPTPPPTTALQPNGPPITPPVPEPSTLTIALVSAAAVGSMRLLRRKSRLLRRES